MSLTSCGACGTFLNHPDEACPNCLWGTSLVERPPTLGTEIGETPMKTHHVTPKELAEALQAWYAMSDYDGSGGGPVAMALFEDYGNMTWKDAANSAATGTYAEYDPDAH